MVTEDAPIAALRCDDGTIATAGSPCMLTLGERPTATITDVTQDTWLDFDVPTFNFGSDDKLHTDAIPEHVGLLRFDLSVIPVGSSLVVGELAAFVYDAPSQNLTAGTITAFALREEWTEGDALGTTPGTANVDYRRDGELWTAQGAGGASIDPNDVWFELVDGQESTMPGVEFVVPVRVATLQRWVDDPAANFGVALHSSQDGFGICASEHAMSERRPLLRVTFMLP